MSTSEELTLESFIERCQGQTTPFNKYVSYFTAVPVEDRDLRALMQDPLAVLPPRANEALEGLVLVFVPYLKRVAEPQPGSNGMGPAPMVTFADIPFDDRAGAAYLEHEDKTYLFLAIRDLESNEYHYALFNGLAHVLVERMPDAETAPFWKQIKEELKSSAHGELDERSWALKQELIERQASPTRETKTHVKYRRQALEDTLTLFLHGLCCDIDLEAGPRQLTSAHIRQRLEILRDAFPPPEGVALLPEDLGPRA